MEPREMYRNVLTSRRLSAANSFSISNSSCSQSPHFTGLRWHIASWIYIEKLQPITEITKSFYNYFDYFKISVSLSIHLTFDLCLNLIKASATPVTKLKKSPVVMMYPYFSRLLTVQYIFKLYPENHNFASKKICALSVGSLFPRH